jgi:hypothetical protein
MAKGKRPYSSIGLDTELLNDPSFLKSDAMKRIEEEQAVLSATTQAPPKNNAEAQPTEEPVAETSPVQEKEEIKETSSVTKAKSTIQEIFTRGSMHDKDFSSMTLHHDVLEDLHELARVRDGEGRRYPVKYLATNIIKCYLKDHKEEIERIKKEFRMRRA